VGEHLAGGLLCLKGGEHARTITPRRARVTKSAAAPTAA
jgi:hypothetical protein